MERINAGYKIVQSIRINPTEEIVIGHAVNPARPAQYVCWNCINGEKYFNGTYVCTYRVALSTACERIARQYDDIAVEDPHAYDVPTEECRIVGCNGPDGSGEDDVTVVIHRYGVDDYSVWFTGNPEDETSGCSTRGSLTDIIYELHDYID